MLGAPLALVLDAASYALSALSALLIGTPEPAPTRQGPTTGVWRDIAEGVTAIVHNPYLRAFSLAAAALDVFWNALYAVYILYVTRTLGLSPAAVGLILSAGSGAALIVAPLTGRTIERVGLGRVVIATQVVLGAGSLLIALAMAAPSLAFALLVVAEVVQAGAGTISWIAQDSVRQVVTPDQLRGRVGAAIMCLGFGAALVGTALGGVLGELVGVPAAIVLGAVGGLWSFGWLVRSPVRKLRRIDDIRP